MPHLAHLERFFPLAGRDVVDIGAGNGALAARMQASGARVVAVEVDETMAARAPAGVDMRVGRAEALPLADASLDLAVFFFSLHHVPAELHDRAIAEVSRVLRPNGRLHVAEPLPEGRLFDLVRLIDDETEVRHQAQATLRDLAQAKTGFHLVDRCTYAITRQYADLDDFIDRHVANYPERAARLPETRDKLAEKFNAAAPDGDGLRSFDQPCVALHFEAR